MEAQIIIDKDTYDKFKSFEKILKALDGRLNIELLSTFSGGMRGYLLSEFIIQDDHDILASMKNRLEEAREEKHEACRKLDNVHSFLFMKGNDKIRCREVISNWKTITADSK